MTPADFKQSRHKLGLSQSQLAIVLNIDVSTIKRWEAGTRDVSPIADRAMGWFLAGFRPIQWPK